MPELPGNLSSLSSRLAQAGGVSNIVGQDNNATLHKPAQRYCRQEEEPRCLCLASGMLCKQQEAHRKTSWPTHEEALVLVAIPLTPRWCHATYRYSHVHPPCEHQQSVSSYMCRQQQQCMRSKVVHTASELVVLGNLPHISCLDEGQLRPVLRM